MKNLFTSKSIKFKSFKKFLAFIFILLTAFPIHSFSQVPNPTLPGFNCNFNNPDGNLAYKCGTIITATINLPETPELASFTLTFPNSFQVINFNNCTQGADIINAGAFINYASTTTDVIDGDLVTRTYTPVAGATTCTLNFAYRNCNLYPDQTNGAPANFDRMFFNCEGADAANTATIHRPTINTNMINASTLAARVTNSTSPAIEITSSTLNPQIGYANTNYDRNFTVKLNSASIQNFDFFIANETDIAA